MRLECPICNSQSTETIFRPDPQPLARYGLCPSEETANIVEKYPLRIEHCKSCGVMFNSKFQYSEVDYSAHQVLESRVFSPEIKKFMMARAKELQSEIPLKDKVVLEIGCGEGFFLSQFVEGSTTAAFEPSSEGYMASSAGISVYHESFDPCKIDYELTPTLIIMRQVLEHLQHPEVYLNAFADLLSKGTTPGFLYIEVPNSSRSVENSRFYDFYFEHYTYFKPGSLSILAEKAGFIVRYCKEEFSREILSMLCEIKPKHSDLSSGLELKLRKIRSVMLELVSQNKRIAGWGSSGSGSALLNFCGLDNSIIANIIDSDPRKQGQYLPGTRQKIVAPDFFVSAPPDAILILSQLHKADIAKKIFELYGDRVEIINPDFI